MPSPIDNAQQRSDGRFVARTLNPSCPNPAHKDAIIQSSGKRVRANGVTIYRYRCVTPSREILVNGVPARGPKPKRKQHTSAPEIVILPRETHKFSVCLDEDVAPTFAKVKCSTHPGSRVARAGTNNANGTRHQRYLCGPVNGEQRHRFTLPLPRQSVERDPQWKTSDVVRNPHRGATASGRGQTTITEAVSEGLQMLSQGTSYAKVGLWAGQQRPTRAPRTRPKGVTRKTRKNLSANYWQTGADWVEMFSPVLWDAWQTELANEPPTTLPRVLVIDDVPFFAKTAGERARSSMVFSILVATEYYQTAPGVPTYRQRVRLIRAYPNHNADAYELLVTECGVVPDVIVSDSSTAILRMVKRLKKTNPDLVWVPSAYHVAKQLTRALNAMRWGRPVQHFVPLDLLDRLEDYSFLGSPKAWEQWWRDLENRARSQGVPADKFPTHWHSKYYQLVADGLGYLATHPSVPRSTGAVEATIRGNVKPFFEPRAATFTNIERINRLADLLTLRLNGRMDRRSDIATLLRRDAEGAGGYVPPARSVTERKGERLLHNPAVIVSSLGVVRKDARKQARKVAVK